MNKFAIVVHGGAGPDSAFIQQHQEAYKNGLEAALHNAYALLEKGASATDAVEVAVKTLEDNPIFNAGRGSALNAKGEVEMCASIMQGKDRKAGAVAIVKKVKNPITLARAVMDRTKHVYIGSHGALEFARELNLSLETDSYFITEHQYDLYRESRDAFEKEEKEKTHGTVGAVALDQAGNIAAATSTGGLEYCKEGRIADSSMVGAGVYADNRTCAVSTTGEGEYHMRNVSAFHIAALMAYKGLPVNDACNHLIHVECGDVKADMGLIAIDAQGNIGISFNTERMHRGFMTSDGKQFTASY